MSKSSKPTLFLVFVLLLIVTVFALFSVGIKLKYEQTLLLKDDTEKKLKTEEQKKIKLTAEYQSVTSEERIFAIANTDLGLIRNLEAPVVVKYDSDKVEEFEKELKNKYE